MATITNVSPENGATGVGLIAAGVAWITVSFSIGESGEPWGIGDCNGFEFYLDGVFHHSSYGWKEAKIWGGSLGSVAYYSAHTWRVDIIVITGAGGQWETVTGDTWSFTAGGPPANIRNARLGAGGNFILAPAEDGIYISSDFGDNWTKKNPDGEEDTIWEKGVCSSDGTYCIVVSGANAVYRTANGGDAWGAITPAGGDTFTPNDVAISSDGQFTVIVGENLTDTSKSCYLSTNYGVTWTSKNPVSLSVEWANCSISDDGTLIMVSASGYFEVSFDSGETWSGQTIGATETNWECLGVSGDGTTGLVANLSTPDEFFIGTRVTAYSLATWEETDITSTARSLLDDTTQAAQQTTLGLGTEDSPTFAGLTLTGYEGIVTVAGGVLAASNTLDLGLST